MKIKKLHYKPSQLNHEKIWNNYNKMIMKIAHRISKKYDKPYDELLSEGMFGVFKKLPQWDSRKSRLCTYIYRCTTFQMLDYCIKPIREIPMDLWNPDLTKNPFMEKETKANWFQSFFNELTEETKHLVKILFEAPEELYEAVKPNQPKTSQKKLRNYMMDVLDWNRTDVDRAFEEVMQCL